MICPNMLDPPTIDLKPLRLDYCALLQRLLYKPAEECSKAFILSNIYIGYYYHHPLSDSVRINQYEGDTIATTFFTSGICVDVLTPSDILELSGKLSPQMIIPIFSLFKDI